MSKSGDYKTIKNQHTVYIHPSSVLHKQEVRGYLSTPPSLPLIVVVVVVMVGTRGSPPFSVSAQRVDFRNPLSVSACRQMVCCFVVFCSPLGRFEPVSRCSPHPPQTVTVWV